MPPGQGYSLHVTALPTSTHAQLSAATLGEHSAFPTARKVYQLYAERLNSISRTS